MEDPAAAAVGSPLEKWSELLLGVARSRVQKRKAVAEEDFTEAGRLKRQEADLVAQIEKAKKAAEAAAGGAGGGASAALAEERQSLEEAKRRAVEAEDFAEAARLKKRIKVLEEQGGGATLDQQALEKALALASASGDAAAVSEELKASPASGVAPPKAAAPAKPPTVRPASVPEARPAAAVKQEVAKAPAVKAEVKGCSVPGVSVAQLLAMTNQDVWQKAWEVTWQKADAAGQADDEKQVYAQAQKTWKLWLAERDRLGKEQSARSAIASAEPGRAPSPAAAVKAEEPKAGGSAPSAATSSSNGRDALRPEHRRAQEAHWRESKTAQADWERATAEAERRKKAKEGGEVKSSRDLCSLVKARCPADQPLQFERLLAVCPANTTVRQLIQAMAKEPQEFRQNFDGSEFCVRPVNSTCADWLAVQASTTPPGFRDDACLPESMLNVAKTIFEERLRPQGQAAEDPLATYLAQPGRIPPDTPVPFLDLLTKCPPGTQPMDLVRTMSKRRDIFRQDASGAQFCVRPRVKCRDWGAVNPYADPTAALGAGAGAGAAAPKPAAKAAAASSSTPCGGDY